MATTNEKEPFTRFTKSWLAEIAKDARVELPTRIFFAVASREICAKARFTRGELQRATNGHRNMRQAVDRAVEKRLLLAGSTINCLLLPKGAAYRGPGLSCRDHEEEHDAAALRQTGSLP